MAGDGQCLSVDELTSLLQGEAPPRERDRWIRHLDGCRDCRTIFAESARHLAKVSNPHPPASLPWRLLGVAVVALLVMLYLLRISS